MAYTPAGLDHVNIYVRNAEQSHRWYTDVFGFHTQDTMTHPGTDKLRAVRLESRRASSAAAPRPTDPGSDPSPPASHP